MTNLERIEFGLIFVIALSVYFLSLFLPTHVPIGLGVIWLAAAVFFQSLIRDLTLLSRYRSKKQKPSIEAVEKQCFCFESLLGVGVLLIGFLLFFSGNTIVIVMNQLLWTIVVSMVLVIGFLIKDLVITWRPFGIRRDPNHMNIIVKW